MSAPSPGRLGPYEILSSLGKGGMGEVWRARDPRLNREVAIKISAQQFTDRFEREAHAIASLNHPNICTLFDVGPNYLVMELIEGPTLAERIAEGPIPLEEALALTRQVADALEAAHDKGIVHRDLKPANIKIRPDGSVKVLDFGLAKAGAGESAVSSESPTMLHTPTQIGVILGTAAYMAPEQARGKTVDKRADIWSFGVVLHEMVTGKRAFEGEDLADTLASVVKSDPDLAPVPPKLRRLLAKCLQKDPRKRLRDIGDAWDLLDNEQQPARSEAIPAKKPILAWAIAAIAVLAAAAIAATHFRATPQPLTVTRSAILSPEKASFNFTSSINTAVAPPALSPDGRSMIFGANTQGGNYQLYLHSFDTGTARPLAGTDGAIYPFWSPDGRSVAFGSQGKLKKIDVNGGPPVTLADAPNLRGGSWSPDGVIVFAPVPDGSLERVAASGGAVTPVTSLEDANLNKRHIWPWFLPDGKHFLYAAALIGTGAGAEIRVASLESNGIARTIYQVPGRASSQAIYAQGHLLFVRDQTLMAQPFDAARLAVTGEAVPVTEQVSMIANTLDAPFSASANGVLVFQTNVSTNESLTWFDRAGNRTPVPGDPMSLNSPRLSPDGKRVAFTAEVSGNYDVWIQDLTRNLRSRLTFDPVRDIAPVWSPDGKIIVFASNRKGVTDLYRKPTDGTGTDDLLWSDGATNKTPNDWSRDGKYLLYRSQTLRGDFDLYYLPMAGDAKPVPFVRTDFSEQNGRFSPDGRWVAYQSDESGRNEVYLTPFPGAGGKRQVSTAGGATPQWRADGKELYYEAPDSSLMAVETRLAGGDIEIGATHALFHVPPGSLGLDVAADGQRFIVAVPDRENSASQTLTLVQNWTAGIKK
jgi:serine/threonine protein kinase